MEFCIFFFNDTATPEIYTLPYTTLFRSRVNGLDTVALTKLDVLDQCAAIKICTAYRYQGDRKSTRLNSSHGYTSYAVFCLKKKKKLYSSRVSLRGTSTAILRQYAVAVFA